MSAPRNHDYEGNEQPRQQQQSSLADDHELAEEAAKLAAKIVESNITTRLAWLLIANAGVLIGFLAAGLNAYYSLERRQSTVETRITINDSRIERLQDNDQKQRDQQERRDTDLSNQLNSIRQMFYEHDRSLAGQQRR